MVKIVAATRNKKKLAELKRILKAHQSKLEILCLDDFPDCPEVEETGQTFEQNAVMKAREIARCAKMPSLADDSGLEVDALAGAPGVRSARYAGEKSDDGKNIRKLLDEMKGIPPSKRGARFRAVIALAVPVLSKKVIKKINITTFEGVVEGNITETPMGPGGFGYDPIFQPLGYSETFAQMSPAQKDALSHRARALAALELYLQPVGITHKKN